VSLGRVSARFLAGIGAWVVGAGAATGGSLFAVSLLGQSLAPSPTQQLSVAAVNHALHQEAVAAAKAARARPTPSRSPAEPDPPAVRLRAKRSPKPTPSPTPSPQPTPVTVSTEGGNVVATCNGSVPVVKYWTTAQNYQMTSEASGSTLASVTFSGWQNSVNVQVTCVGGVPSAVVTINNSDGGGGPGGNNSNGGGSGGPW
jgi:hypothetical protein